MKSARIYHNISKADMVTIPEHSNEVRIEESIVISRTANEWIDYSKGLPIPHSLFGNFWHEGELCILIADTNVGKSILAVQIANWITKGINNPWLPIEAESQPVLYCDFELNAKQFENRYSLDYTDHYHFDDRFIRLEINTDHAHFENFNDQLIAALEKTLIERNIKTIIIDNITYLRSEAMDTAKAALPLMQKLKHLKNQHNLSMLILAHTPKRPLYSSLTRNDLAGSKALANFADSIFAIGQSKKSKSIRYIKELKTRATEILFDSANVLECEIRKDHNNLQYHFIGTGHENEHLFDPPDKDEVSESILAYKRENPNASLREIAEQFKISHTQVGKIINRNLS